ncbi:MAG: hypothetical protein HY331_14805 [Chloroflexi bacterium]|nr:hypothetical protein [Chloroflexota bacterium]
MAIIAPTPGATTVVSIPDNQGAVVVPGNAVGNASVRVEVRIVPTPANVPTAVVVLRSIEVSFTNAADGSAVTDLADDVTIEISYAGLELSDEQLGRLAIYNASRGEYLSTAVDRNRQVAMAKTRRFSIFALVQVAAPIPRAYLPIIQKLRPVQGGW